VLLESRDPDHERHECERAHGDGALVLLALIAAFALVGGVSELVVAIGGKRLLERELKCAFKAELQPSS
jgi:hypothetical protein